MSPATERWRYRLHTTVARIGGPAHLACRCLHNLPGPDFDVVVDGFPRSANTWTVVALRHANPDLRILSHTHCPRTLRSAIREGIPPIVLLRDPVAAVASLLVREPHLRVDDGLVRYVRTYQELDPTECLVAPFEQVLRDLRPLVDALSSRLDRRIESPDLTDDAVQRTLIALIDEADRQDQGHLDHTTVSRPSTATPAKVRAAALVRASPRLPAAVFQHTRLLMGAPPTSWAHR